MRCIGQWVLIVHRDFQFLVLSSLVGMEDAKCHVINHNIVVVFENALVNLGFTTKITQWMDIFDRHILLSCTLPIAEDCT